MEVCSNQRQAHEGADRDETRTGSDTNEEVFEVDTVLGVRILCHKDNVIIQYKIRWVGFSAADDSWEPLSNLTGCWDKIRQFHRRARIPFFRSRPL